MSPEADALKEEGLRLFRIGEHSQALDHFERAYDAYMAADRPLDAAEMNGSESKFKRFLNTEQHRRDLAHGGRHRRCCRQP